MRDELAASVPVIDAALVERLLVEQFPEWAGLSVRPVDVDGWDNRSFRVGDELVARLPSGPVYEPQVEKEARWLRVLAGGVTLPIPEVTAVGHPGAEYPMMWSVRRWIEGTPLSAVVSGDGLLPRRAGVDADDFAADLAAFVGELRAIDPVDGPGPGPHSAGRGGTLEQWHDDLARASADADPRIDTDAVERIWAEALAARDEGAPTWCHGDMAAGNLLVAGGRLTAVIDFGCAAVGDPACDLSICWTLFDESTRRVFRSALDPRDSEWRRGRGWALWKALITLGEPAREAGALRTLDELGALRPSAS